jgi:membrane protease YdiL (CAAX protease family)
MISWSSEPLSTFGLTNPIWWLDSLTGSLVYMLDSAVTIVGIDVFVSMLMSVQGREWRSYFPELEDWYTEPHGWIGVAALLLLSVSVGFAEELLDRGFILTRIEQLFNSRKLAVLLSAAFFGIGHLHGGAVHVWSTFLTGVVYGSVFVLMRRLWPLVLAHSLIDFVLFLRAS